MRVNFQHAFIFQWFVELNYDSVDKPGQIAAPVAPNGTQY
jgi:hypothetical protein